jgi:sulfide:quinone oxidoreductase
MTEPDEMQKLLDSPSRRRVLVGMLGVPVAAAVAMNAATAAAMKTSVRIVILGSGLGGLAVANRLSRELDGAKITIVDRKEIHNYQPGYTLVGAGIWPVGKVADRNSEFQPAGVQWIQEMAVEIDPETQVVVTDAATHVPYDFLVVATGLHLDFAQIEGMDTDMIGSHGLGCIYPSPQAAEATWNAMDAFRQKGGEALMTLPATPLKCAGAPLKMTFMLDDRLRQAGTRAKSKVSFHSAIGNIFSVPVVAENVVERWQKKDIPVVYHSKLVAIDIGAQRATFANQEGQRTELGYDFIHAVPPMRAPDVIKNSALSIKEGPMATGGWLEVDKFTLQHKRYPNVFGIGDINGTPRGKTAATIKKSAPIVVENLRDAIAGKIPSAPPFDGYTSCPLLIREGSALLVEFNYEGQLVPSLPGIEPLQDSYMAWLMKYRLLKPAYIAVAKGRV